MVPYRLSRKADQDIADHYQYGIRRFGIAKARDYLLGLHDCFESLSINPKQGRVADELYVGLFKYSYGSHVIFYMVEDNSILVARVLGKKMDYPRHLIF